MIEVGDLVRIKQSTNIVLVDKMGIVVHKGTWSADVHIVDSNSNWEPRLPLENLEKL